MTRPTALQALIEALETALAAASPSKEANRVTRQIFDALRDTEGRHVAAPKVERLDCLDHFQTAVSIARKGPPQSELLSGALHTLSPSLAWQRRAGTSEANADSAFYNGHATTAIVGPMGIEVRSDIIIGAGLLAPNVTYPVHSHPPVELYSVLSDSEWYNETAGWYSPGLGNTVYHEPHIHHAMRAGTAPLLAVWALYTNAPGP